MAVQKTPAGKKVKEIKPFSIYSIKERNYSFLRKQVELFNEQFRDDAHYFVYNVHGFHYMATIGIPYDTNPNWQSEATIEFSRSKGQELLFSIKKGENGEMESYTNEASLENDKFMDINWITQFASHASHNLYKAMDDSNKSYENRM